MLPILARLGSDFGAVSGRLLGAFNVMQRAGYRKKKFVTIKLLKDTPRLGSKGEMVQVKPGRMRNHLYPDGRAAYAVLGRKPVRDRMAETIAKAKNLNNLPNKARLALVAEQAIASIIQRQEYILLLIRGEVLFGAPLHRVEDSVSRLSQVLHLQMTLLSIPGLHLISFAVPSTHTSELRVHRTTITWNIGKLEALKRLSQAVLSSNRPIEEILVEMRPLVYSGPMLHPWPIEMATWLIGSAAVSVVFYNELFETTAAIIIAFAVTALRNHPFLTRAAAEFTVAIVSNALARYFRCIAVVPTLPSLLMLVPGSFVVRGVLSIVGGDTASDSLAPTVHMILICLSLTLGLFLASFVAYPFESERKSILTLM
ncbi:hypothetical protein BJ684DRAFT_19902 [Piptocephalis cylindrospora]|uniref:Threonine/serine exporter-like N-terminal domain-containing protein n=1 Tax=Piptocephalis cylindrospora TaxID=1907219 RepID=A0A4P9Y6Y5_9FUNG|nr:hypothetical protein BJ684DRAFT_19902 [Piptocephalis cylindrospora]|eukprot:RKP13620.1 hypothetical protein BJ684DRAFT_19902 [Piptocephalis cylindrospora]